MKHVDPRRPSPADFPQPHGLWSLWDMLSDWGYLYFTIGGELAYADADLRRYRAGNAGVAIGQPIMIESGNPIIDHVYGRCEDILRLAGNQDLGAIPSNIESLKAKILAARKRLAGPGLSVDSIIDDVTKIKNDFSYILHNRFFYYIRRDLTDSYGKPELFGNKVTKRFRASQDDIEHAGNCLALGETTACVLHLMRAMEGAIGNLAKKLKVTINPRDTWGGILNNMDAAIKALPHSTTKEQQKKDLWSECRVNLYHVKQAWRDPSMHPRRSYDEKQAAEIMRTVRVFMEQLAAL